MSAVIFVYKKKEAMTFLSLEDALAQESTLKSTEWNHLATIDAAIMLTNIHDICQEDYGSDEKISEIIKLINCK